MKISRVIVALVIGLLMVSQALAQDDGGNLFDEIKEVAKAEAEEVLSPVVQAFGMGVTGGLYHTAKTHGKFGFDVGIRAMMVQVSDGEGVLDSADVSMLPIPVAQVSVGLPMDFEVMLRGFSITVEEETISLFGLGVKKNFNHLIPVPAFPDVAAMLAYHSFKGGDILSSSHISFDVMVSKTFAIITPYAGFGFDSHKMDIEYDYVEPTTQITVPIALDIKESTTRLTIGASISPFPFVKLFGDYNIGKYNEISAGLAVSIR